MFQKGTFFFNNQHTSYLKVIVDTVEQCLLLLLINTTSVHLCSFDIKYLVHRIFHFPDASIYFHFKHYFSYR